ncbi:MAG: hypothetical protein MUF38_16010 [Anaerolineae bacterium]|jgi:hypothetical protein|nr:hypothetical protein [Anaerolineae bacterium]
MLIVNFEGWTQCRFATDPDPSDEKRGISGPTFATPDEPDLDRKIRLQNPVAIRYPRDKDFGVFVKSVSYQNTATGAVTNLTDYPLIGAAVDLLDGPEYYQHNLILTEEAWNAPIDPFVLNISKDGIVIQRRDLWDVTRPDLTIYDVYTDPVLLKRRSNVPALQSTEVAEATGAVNYERYRQQRRLDLIKLRDALLKKKSPKNKLKILGLEQRIGSIDKDQTMVGIVLAGQQFLGMQASYAFSINGQHLVEDRKNQLNGEIGASMEWPLSFWMGGYDVDTMCSYMRGSLSLPFYPNERFRQSLA